MFPDIRLMIAAVLATVVVLICGFGMFAAFRVSHEPLTRLPAASIPNELLGDDTVTSTEDPFDRRFQISVAMLTVSRTSNVSAQPQDQHNDADTGAATLAAPSAPAVAEPSTTPVDAGRAAGEPIDQAAPEAPQPDQAPAETAAAPEPGDEQTPVVSAPQGEPAPPAPAPSDTASEAEHPPPAAIAAEPAGESAPAAAAVIAAELSSERIPQSADQASVAPKPALRSADKASDKAAKAKSVRVARIHRVRRVASAFRPQPSDQVNAFAQPNFQTAVTPAPWPVVARRPTRVRLVRAAPEKTKKVVVASYRVKKLSLAKVNKVASGNVGKSAPEKTNNVTSEKAKEPEAGIGGPFVAPPGPTDLQTPPNPLTPPNQ